ncbi:MAG TPA: SMC family ATPase [Gemmataceae bacterium]|nr:SMC family ATPase [Gemmataceae bacterium]
MIPQRIRLKGFLCYKDEQEITFDSNATLWMLSGLNGSGKSSIFDAVTYALFGHHRGGSQHAVELINKDSDGLTVEFDFRLDTQVYRVRRTLRKSARGSTASTQQIYGYDPNAKNNWVAVEGSNYRREFDTWIAERIGLTYETFTSSVLLLQGKADKLLDSKPEGRRAVLASIVDLDRYERLHEKADDKRKKLKGQMEALSDRLAALPEVKLEQETAAGETIRAAEEARQQANAEVDRLRELEHRAKAWMELQGRLAAARQRWQQAEHLLGEAADIDQKLARLRELREVLPRLYDIVRLRGDIHSAEVETKNLLQLKQKATDQLAQRASALKQAQDKRASLQVLIAGEETQQHEMAEKLLILTEQMAKLREHERHEAELKRIHAELAPLPVDPMAEVSRAREKHDALAALNNIVPQLARFAAYRDDLRQAVGREQTAEQRLQQVECKGKSLGAEVKRLEPLVEQADRATRQASERATEARTLLKQAQDSLHELTQLDGRKVCRLCAQPLTPGHLQEEKRRRGEDMQHHEARLKKDQTDLQAAQKEEKQLREQLVQAQKVHQAARDEYQEARNQQKQARADVTRLQDECTRTWNDLPETERQRISARSAVDWLTTSYPSAEELEASRARIAELPAARRQLKEAEDVHQQWNKLKATESAALATLKRLQGELPADREGVRQRHTELSLTNETLEKNLKAKRSEWKDTERESERLGRERDQSQAQLKELEHRLKDQDLVRQHARQAVSSNTKALPADWQTKAESAGLAEWHVWDNERADLEASGIEQRGQALQQARANLNVFRQDVETLEERQTDFAEEERRDPADIKAELERARQAESLRDKALTEARQQLALLHGYRKQREQIGEDFVRLEGEWTYQKTLSELLGKDRLQLYLVRQAEKQVVEFANAVLDRLSGGQLYLKLRGEAEGEGNSGKALELEAYNRSTGEKPINVAFLSGSQKFRVAVSLALGIGQYASRQHRPIESVIIDEGFGCLDSQGRQVMIQELQNLRSQMRCILLVSHQEEFAEAFSDGYHFELESGATKVKRFQK